MGIPYDPIRESLPSFLFSEEINLDDIGENEISQISQNDIIELYTRKMREELK